MTYIEALQKRYSVKKFDKEKIVSQEKLKNILEAGRLSVSSLGLQPYQIIVVETEELKKQLGNALPGAIKAATMAYQTLHPEMKVTEEFFMEQMKAGKVLSSELLPELAKAYEKLYGIENVKRAETLQAAQERLQNSWTDLVRSMNSSETGGISLFFKFIIFYA